MHNTALATFILDSILIHLLYGFLLALLHAQIARTIAAGVIHLPLQSVILARQGIIFSMIVLVHRPSVLIFQIQALVSRSLTTAMYLAQHTILE